MEILPAIPLGGKQITRLIVGGNPFRGNSHFSPEMSRDMSEYYTVDQVKRVLFDCEAHGINTVQARGDVLVLQCIREYWAEGGTMNFIAQTASELADLRAHVRALANFGALGVYVHGTFTDAKYQAGEIQAVRDLAKSIRDSGAAVGVGTHIPEVVELIDDEGWDVDFYMACLYDFSRRHTESAIISGKHNAREEFVHEDRFAMLERIRATDKTCLAFKILGAGRLCESEATVQEAFETAYSGIKASDACVVGMFPKYTDQVAENARIVRGILT